MVFTLSTKTYLAQSYEDWKVFVSKKCVSMAAYYDAWTWILNDWLWVTPYNRLKLWNFVTVLVFRAWKVEYVHEYSSDKTYNEYTIFRYIFMIEYLQNCLESLKNEINQNYIKDWYFKGCEMFRFRSNSLNEREGTKRMPKEEVEHTKFPFHF